MPMLTIKAQIHADPETERVLRDAMFCATKVYNGLMWHLRQQQEATGRVDVRRSNLNRILAELPRAKGYYSLSVQLTRGHGRVTGAARTLWPYLVAVSWRTEAQTLARILRDAPEFVRGRTSPVG